MSIPFTQYLMPDGRKSAVVIDRPEEVEDMARQCVDAGVVFEAEMLSDYNSISFEAVLPVGKGDPLVLSAELVLNGPEVLGAVDRLVKAAYQALKTKP